MVLINGRARVVRELVVELNLRSVEAFLRSVERHLGGLPGLMKIFKLP